LETGALPTELTRIEYKVLLFKKKHLISINLSSI